MARTGTHGHMQWQLSGNVLHNFNGINQRPHTTGISLLKGQVVYHPHQWDHQGTMWVCKYFGDPSGVQYHRCQSALYAIGGCHGTTNHQSRHIHNQDCGEAAQKNMLCYPHTFAQTFMAGMATRMVWYNTRLCAHTSRSWGIKSPYSKSGPHLGLLRVHVGGL